MGHPEPGSRHRRIAVLLGSGSSCRRVLNDLLPLLESEPGIEIEGILLEEAELETAAELPFVREVCRLTLTVRDFRTADVRRVAARRVRETRQQLATTAERMGAEYSLRSVRGPALGQLREALERSDIIFFEPLHASALYLLGATGAPSEGRRVAVLIDDTEAAAGAARAAYELARRRPQRVTLLLTPQAAKNPAEVERTLAGTLPPAGRIVDRLGDDSVSAIIAAARRTRAGVLVLPAWKAVFEEDNLRRLQNELNCPVIVVR